MTQHSNLDPSERSLPVRRQAVDVQRQKPPTTRFRTEPVSAQNNGISPAFLWQVFCQWWQLAVPVGLLLAACTGYLVWFFHVPLYESVALIEIRANRPYIAFENGIEKRDQDRYVQTQIELLRGPVVLWPVLGRSEIALMHEFMNEVNPLEHLQKHLVIIQIGKSALYQVHYVSPSAKDAAAVANAVVQEYLRMQKQEDQRRTELVINVLEEERLNRSTRVEQLRQRVIDLAKEVTGRDPFGQGAVTDINRALSPVDSLYQSLNEVEVNSEIVRAELQSLQDAQAALRDPTKISALIDFEISNQADVRELEAGRAEIQEKIAARMKVRSGNAFGVELVGDTELQVLQRQLASTKAKLVAHKARLRKELQGLRVQELKAERQQLIANKIQELNSLNARRTLLTEKFDKHVAELKASGAQSAQLEFAKAELEREERVFELIAARKLSLQTELEAPDRVSLRREASVPSLAAEAVPYKMLLIVCLASMVCPFAIALAREMTVQRICDTQQLASESQLPILGEVTRFPVRPVATGHHGLPARQQREMFIFAESIDSLRTNLMLTEDLGGEGQPRVIAIASAASGEGKTSVATSLAVSIAGATKKPTLLIDADLRSPDVAKVLGVTARPGLTEVFAGKASLSEAIHPSGQTNTYVLPAGVCHVNPHHVIQGSRIDELFDGLRAKFSTILVDMPPILGASESLVYAKAADMVVFCSLSSVSRARQVRGAVGRLQTTGANVVGAVLSGIPIRRNSYAYGYPGDAGNMAEVDS